MIILVTGASSGIGAACVERLRKAGHTVIGASRSGTAGCVLDIRDPAAIDRALREIVGQHGRLDAVVNSAGVAVGGPLEETPLDLVHAQLETNLMGAVYLARASAPYLRQSAPSRFVHISSLAAHVALPYQALYSAAHFGMSGFCQALRYEMAPHGVRVLLVEPGSVRTGLTGNRRGLMNSDAYPAAEVALRINDQDELGGVDADRIAQTVERMLTDPSPPDRISVGHWHERIGLLAKRFLPAKLFRWIIGSHYSS